MQKNATKITDLTAGDITRSLLIFSWPLMLANLLQIVYNMVDMVVVGQYVGSTGLSAVSCGGDITNLATTLCMGFTSAGQVLISQQIGSGDRKNLSGLVGSIFTFFTMIAVGISATGILCVDFLLSAINVPAEAYVQAREYSVYCLAATIFVFGYNTISAILRGMGDSIRPLIFISLSSVTNLILDIWFVAYLGWGAKGAALATAAGQALSFVISAIYLYRKQSDFSLNLKLVSFIPEKKTMLVICQLGIPMALQGAAVNISKLFVHSFINAYGVVASAVSGVGTKICQCSMVVSSAMSTAGTTMVGQNFGAGKMDRIRKTVYTTLLIALAYNWLLAFVMLIMPSQVFSLFTSEQAVLNMAPSYAVIAALVFNGSALRVPFSALIGGQGNSKLSLAIGILDGIVARVGFSLLFGEVMSFGIMGFWLGDVMASHVPAIIGGIYFGTGMWKKFTLPAGRKAEET